jgi:hypothetical protein
LIASEALDGAILDVNVHGEKSYPVAQMLVRQGLPFIFATGYGDSLHPAEYDGVPTVTKPYSLGDLERAFGLQLGAEYGDALNQDRPLQPKSDDRGRPTS